MSIYQVILFCNPMYFLKNCDLLYFYVSIIIVFVFLIKFDMWSMVFHEYYIKKDSLFSYNIMNKNSQYQILTDTIDVYFAGYNHLPKRFIIKIVL